MAKPHKTEPYLSSAIDVVDWERARELLDKADAWLLATVRPNGIPHLSPILALWSGDDLVFCTDPHSIKGANLERNSAVSVSGSSRDGFLVAEGNAILVTSDAEIESIAAAYRSRFGWDPEPGNGQFHAKGAPTAGDGPKSVYRVVMRRAFAFGQDESFPPTRYIFDVSDV